VPERGTRPSLMAWWLALENADGGGYGLAASLVIDDVVEVITISTILSLLAVLSYPSS
jgi:hypothetical protein